MKEEKEFKRSYMNEIDSQIADFQLKLETCKNEQQLSFKKWINIFSIRNKLYELALKDISYDEKINEAVAHIDNVFNNTGIKLK